MEYTEYFTRFPDAYERVVSSLNRVETLYDFLKGTLALKVGESVLSIGCGDAAVELRLAREFDLCLCLVEPADSYLEKARTEALGSGVKLRESFSGPFQEYESDHKYDYVFSLYSWFAFGLDRSLLLKALNCLKPGGTLLVLLQGEAAPSTHIARLSRAAGIGLTSERFSTWATQDGFEHQQAVYPGRNPASTFLAENGLNQMGRDWVSFLLATPWNEMQPEIRERSLAVVEKGVRDGHIDLESPCLFFSEANRLR